MSDLKVINIPQHDPRLGRNIVHDERSRGFVVPRRKINRSTWHDKRIRVYDPVPNPDQVHGNCTMCSKASQMNALGNRKPGVRLDMAWAEETYVWETQNDEFPGQMPADDTGSSGLSSCKTAQHYGVGGEYVWEFEGADGVVQNIMEGRVMNNGTRWYEGMFSPRWEGLVSPTGSVAGGHEWSATAYWKSRDWVGGICWWGGFRKFWISRTDLDDLLRDDGDSHWQQRVL